MTDPTPEGRAPTGEQSLLGRGPFRMGMQGKSTTAAAATYPERMEYRMLGEGDGTEDGEAWSLVQAWYWPGESLPREVNDFTVMGGSPEELRRELRALLAATEKPSLTRDHTGKIMEGAE